MVFRNEFPDFLLKILPDVPENLQILGCIWFSENNCTVQHPQKDLKYKKRSIFKLGRMIGYVILLLFLGMLVLLLTYF
jgi:hypothetical protein